MKLEDVVGTALVAFAAESLLDPEERVKDAIDGILEVFRPFGHLDQGKLIAAWAFENDRELCNILVPMAILAITGELSPSQTAKPIAAFGRMIVERYKAAHPNQDGHLN